MSTTLPSYSSMIEGLVRRSWGSFEWQTAQSHPSVGTPMDVPLPSTVKVAFILWPSSSCHYRPLVPVAGLRTPGAASVPCPALAPDGEPGTRVLGAALDPRNASFARASFARTSLQEFLEQLYYERADTSALRWSYSGFRRAHPDVDTRASIEVIGYQMLKMGDRDGAAAVLTMNASDFPRSSSSAFGLGRALVAAGDSARARQEFARALELDPANRAAADALASIRE